MGWNVSSALESASGLRLRENGEVIGTDERFFEEQETQLITNVYAQRKGALDAEGEDEEPADLASYALARWSAAVKAYPAAAKIVPSLPNVVYSIRAFSQCAFL